MDDFLLVVVVVHLLHLIWVALNTPGCAVGHRLTGLVITMPFVDTGSITVMLVVSMKSKVLMDTMWMVCLLLMEVLVHASTYGLLLVACSPEVVAAAAQLVDVHVIMVTLDPHLLLWPTTIFVRVHVQRVLLEGLISIHMLCSGKEGVVRVVASAVGSTIHHGSSKT